MTDTLPELPFSPSTDSPNLGAPKPRRCSRHRWGWTFGEAQHVEACERCGKPKDAGRSRLGRTSRRRGNDYERELAARLGGTKVGHHGGAADVIVSDLFVIQSKVRKAWPRWMANELAKLPRTGGRTPLLVVANAPGSGHAREALVVLGIADWIDLHVGS